MGKPELENSEATKRQISSHKKHNSKQIAEKANEHPDWLPDGWTVDIRTRKSGANMGCVYKCYIDPNGNKFYSKPEVLRYIESIKGNSYTSKKEERCNTTHSPNKDVVEKSAVEDAEAKSAVEDAVVKSAVEDAVDKSTVEEAVDKSTMEDAIEKSTEEDLPPGWIKEIKIRKGGKGKKKDMFYTDPVSGYVFRSKKDVLRYLESGDISTCVLKPNKRQILDEDKLTPSSAGERQKLKQSTTKGQLFAGEEISVEGSLELPDANSSKKGHFASKLQGDIHLKKSRVLSHGQAVVKEKSRQLDIKKIEDHKPEQSQYSLSRDSRSPNVKDAMKTIRADLPSPDNPHNSHGLASEAHVFKGNKLLASGKGGETSKSSSNKYHIPRRASKRLAGVEVNPDVQRSERAPEYKSKKSKVEVNPDVLRSDDGPAMELADHDSVNGRSSNKSMKAPKISPITNDNLEKHEDEEVNDEKSEAQQSFAFHYSWTDPRLEFAIKTLTSALDSGGNEPTRIPETDMSPKNKLSENVAGSSNDKIPRINSSKSKNKKELKKELKTPETDMSPKNKLSENVAGSSNDKIPKVNSCKSKNKKELKTPVRLSKRLAGHEPEVLPAEKALEYATRKSGKDKPSATMALTNGESGHLHAGEESKLIVHASDRLKTTVCGESLNEGEKSYDPQTVPNEQLQRPESENDDNRSEPQFPLSFVDTWSDPCLEFAVKTLTGALPVNAADADNLPVMAPEVNEPPNKALLESVVQKSNDEANDNVNQPQTNKELNTVPQPSKQLLGQPVLRVSSTSSKNDLKSAARESYGDESNITRNWDRGDFLHFKAGHLKQIDMNTPILEEPLKENDHVLEGEFVKEQPRPGTETIKHDNSEGEFCASFMDSWSDPCLEFAFKTLTGAIPVEENIAIRGCFQEPVNRPDQRNGGPTLSEFGHSSVSQIGISFHSDTGEKSLPEHQASMSYSFLTPEKSSLRGHPRVDPQKHHSQCTNIFQRR